MVCEAGIKTTAALLSANGTPDARSADATLPAVSIL